MNKLAVILFALLTFMTSCKKEEPTPIATDSLLIGQWNGYEAGDENGFGPGFYSLTTLYEHGITFFPNKSFAPRYNLKVLNPEKETADWEEWEVAGQYAINNQKVQLHFTISNNDLEVQIVRLDDEELWFRHSYFGREVEYHLKRVK